MKRILLLSLLIVLPLCYFASCKKDKGDPPVLPPSATMLADFSNFTSQKKSAGPAGEIKGTESSTWEFAAALAGVWNTLISPVTAVPVAALQAGTGNKASFVSENLWQWKYDFSSASKSYKAKIQGKISGSTVTWKLWISDEGTGGFSEFLWVEGTSKTDGSGGQWKIKQGPAADVLLFQTDWTRSGDEVTSVKFTYTKSDASQNSYINYFSISSGSFDSGFEMHFADGSYADADIEWNSVTRDGRLNCLDYLQDDSWYCWDNNKINKICD